MWWLMRVLGFGRERETPPHVQEALDSVAEATEATDDSKSAVALYWDAATELNPAAKKRVLSDLADLDRRRARRKK